MSRLFEGILTLPPALVLALTFLFPAVEASIFVGVLVPGEIGVVLGGVLANQGKLPVAAVLVAAILGAVLVAAILGAVIGDSIGYFVGLRWGESILGKLPDRVLNRRQLEAAEQTLRRHGGKSVFIGRFTAALRALVPGAAGMSRMHYPKFLFWNVIGGATWATTYVLVGYIAGSQYHTIEQYANYVALLLLAAIVVLLWVRHRRSA